MPMPKKPVAQFTLGGTLLTVHESTVAAAKHLVYADESAISQTCHGRQKTAYGYKWSFYCKDHDITFTGKKCPSCPDVKPIPVCSYEGCDRPGTRRGGICKLHYDRESRSKGGQRTPPKPIMQFAIDGTLIATHPSVNAAVRSLGKGHHYPNIRRAADYIQDTAYGYIWRYVDDELCDISEEGS